jgi:uncharacterized lipoprotein YajG
MAMKKSILWIAYGGLLTLAGCASESTTTTTTTETTTRQSQPSAYMDTMERPSECGFNEPTRPKLEGLKRK